MRKIAFGVLAMLAATAEMPSYAGVYTAWWGWYETQFNSQGACLDGSHNFLKNQPELYDDGKQSPHTWASYRSNNGSAFVVCAPNGNATIMVTGTGNDYNLSEELANRYRRALGR
ncbi:hypothetical protein QUA13_27710 [Microcoleus sp. S28C3]|uniref:hypothetical protein n=1 Tax=Microcoleus sp. S28C3 TaxID=3055414 RepID=UPI002FD6ED04